MSAQPDHTPRLALVTGAAHGIGRAVARQLAEDGMDIIACATTKSQGALEELDDEIRNLGRSCTLVPFDLTDFDAIDRLGEAIYNRWGRLDVLIANAGVLGPLTPLSHIEVKDWHKTMDVNVTANWRLIRAMEPLLKQAESPRAVFVTSGAAHKHKAYWGAYGVTKAALEALALTFATECNITDIKVNVVDPGPIRTRMRREAVPGEDPETLPTPEQIAALFAELADSSNQRHGDVISFYDWANLTRPA
ncbi:SDR family NAD(P)-dependent oxidoreductase [Yunchengibacter salinarum]|uniref:SDR family NAD(P)-dependent oxidoreductase n=1 Tax=Yunchengibacter salinarum TaxID=3133399 RepID=UPI0035B6AB1A